MTTWPLGDAMQFEGLPHHGGESKPLRRWMSRWSELNFNRIRAVVARGNCCCYGMLRLVGIGIILRSGSAESSNRANVVSMMLENMVLSAYPSTPGHVRAASVLLPSNKSPKLLWLWIPRSEQLSCEAGLLDLTRERYYPPVSSGLVS